MLSAWGRKRGPEGTAAKRRPERAARWGMKKGPHRAKENIKMSRIDVNKYVGTGLGRGLLHLGHEVEKAGIDRTLHELVKIRASQINGCEIGRASCRERV